jgi:hypothetical protein
MRRFGWQVNLGKKYGYKLVTCNVAVYDKDDDTHWAMLSGFPYKEPHFLFLDYDKNYEPKEWEWITKDYSLRRSLAIESSPEKYWFLSFSPLCIGEICEIMFNSKADKKHCAQLLRVGLVALRLSKKVEDYPRVKHTYVNREGTNYYDYDQERLFMKGIEEGLDIDVKGDVFKALTKIRVPNSEEVDEVE